jgi:hypothetical protein
MKRFIQWIALAALVFSLSSCGLPGAVGRTAMNAVKTVGKIIPSATGKITSSGG